MTRETKIGLLVGLGFIVVFAVLLSHTGNVPPPGDSIAPSLAQNPQSDNKVLGGGMRSEIGQPDPTPPTVESTPPTGSGPEAEPAPRILEDRLVNLGDLPDDLPAPVGLGPDYRGEMASADAPRGALPATPTSIFGMRKAPEPSEPPVPEPSVAHNPPSQSPSPDGAASTEVASAAGGKTAPALTSPKEYVVQSRDNLVKIAQLHYKSNDPRVVQFLAKSNEERIKDADTIREGQTLLIPSLPPEMFERVPSHDVHLAAGRAESVDELINGKSRKAPAGGTSPQKDAAPRGPAGASTAADRDKNGSGRSGSDSATSGKTTGQGSPPSLTEDSAPRLSLSGLVPVKPAPGTKSSAAKDAKPARNDRADERESGSQLFRWYEIKPNDTMGSIAKKELGQSAHWQEIKKLNSGIDPRKLPVGERIKIPRKPVSSSSSNGRASA